MGLGPIFYLRCQIMRSAPENLTALLRPVVESLGYEFVGVELLEQGPHGRLLRIYIDQEQGIKLRAKVDGRRKLVGVLGGLEERQVLVLEQGECYRIPLELIESARLVPEF